MAIEDNEPEEREELVETPEEEEPKEHVVEDDDGELEAHTENEQTVVRVKRDPDRKPGESRSQYRSRKAEERTAAQISAALEPFKRQNDELRALLLQNRQEPTQRVERPVPQEGQRQSRFGVQHAKVVKNQELIIAAIKNESDPARIAELNSQFYDLEEEKRAIEVESILRRQGQTRQPKEDVNPVQAYWLQTLNAEYPDVHANEKALNWARATANADIMFREANGLPPRTMDDDRKTLAEAGIKFGIRKPRPAAPTDTQRAKLSGVGASPSRIGGKEFTITSQQRSLAEAMFPGDPKAVEKWVRYMKSEGLMT